MTMQVMTLIVIVLVVAVVVLQVLAIRRKALVDLGPLHGTLGALKEADERIARSVRDELAQSRTEASAASTLTRQELAAALREVNEALTHRLETFRGIVDDRLRLIQDDTAQKLEKVRFDAGNTSKATREELSLQLKGYNDSVLKQIEALGLTQHRQLQQVNQQLEKLVAANQQKIDELKNAVEVRLRGLQEDNAQQLEKMRATVDEKLQGTLEKRLGESFQLVSERLEAVSRGLGEMQTLALGVGDLKRVLTNVKARGTWGEVQLDALLEQVLTPSQYERNVSPRDNGERVEFAIRMPGRGGDVDEVVWLPIDAKFPVEDYQRLLDAQEQADPVAAESAASQLEARIKQCAKDISEKYVCPPQTTDFAILFLPTEGLFSEVIRRRGLAEHIQQQYRVVIAGPTTLWSILTSLQMGFRTLAIQKRSSEVWQVLGAVKTEWKKYADVLEKVKKQLQTAANTVDSAGRRTRAIDRKLRAVEELPAVEAGQLLQLPSELELDGEGELERATS
jgi:DNA recombination protein RmuC